MTAGVLGEAIWAVAESTGVIAVEVSPPLFIEPVSTT